MQRSPRLALAGISLGVMLSMTTWFRAAAVLFAIATMWLVPLMRDQFGWWAAFALFAPGPLLGAVALGRIEPVAAPVRDVVDQVVA